MCQWSSTFPDSQTCTIIHCPGPVSIHLILNSTNNEVQTCHSHEYECHLQRYSLSWGKYLLTFKGIRAFCLHLQAQAVQKPKWTSERSCTIYPVTHRTIPKTLIFSITAVKISNWHITVKPYFSCMQTCAGLLDITHYQKVSLMTSDLSDYILLVLLYLGCTTNHLCISLYNTLSNCTNVCHSKRSFTFSLAAMHDHNWSSCFFIA